MAKEISEFYNKVYFNGKIYIEIVIFSSLIHDLGKIWEYDYSSLKIRTTKEGGELLGYIFIASHKISKISEKKNNPNDNISEKLTKILHIILSHHGKMEFGAPVVPKIPEAIIIYHLDNIDAKLIYFLSSVKKTNKQEEFTQRNFAHENAKLYNIFYDN